VFAEVLIVVSWSIAGGFRLRYILHCNCSRLDPVLPAVAAASRTGSLSFQNEKRVRSGDCFGSD
jgi:hypothetical protein